jgi:hypothetical protein
LGITYNKNSAQNRFEFNQLQGRYNNPSPQELRKQIEDWIQSLNSTPKTVGEWARVAEEVLPY